MNNNDVMVSVIMPVYNHENYIAQAIEGVLMQQTSFKYELIIGEDCSTDNSREIILDYEKRYPDIIKVIYQPVNRGVKNGYMILRKAKGKYWAFCDGDDYWTDCNKLQKQIDFLGNNTEYSAVYHNVICVDRKGRSCTRKSINKYPHKQEQIYTLDMLKGMNMAGQIASLVCRNIYNILGTEERIKLFVNYDCNGDHKMCKAMACIGKIFFMENEMACHRVVLDEGSSYSASVYQKNILLDDFHQYKEVCNMTQKLFNKDVSSFAHEKWVCASSINYARSTHTVKDCVICLKIFGLVLMNIIEREWRLMEKNKPLTFPVRKLLWSQYSN